MKRIKERHSFANERERICFFSLVSASGSGRERVRFFGKERERAREIEERANALQIFDAS